MRNKVNKNIVSLINKNKTGKIKDYLDRFQYKKVLF